MEIRVLFFGLLKDVCGRAEDSLETPAGADAGFVFDHYATLYPGWTKWHRSIVIARNQEFTTRAQALADGDEVAFLPPVSGGSSTAPDSRNLGPRGALFLPDPPSIDPGLETRLLQGLDGAIVTFQGVVRNNTRGRVRCGWIMNATKAWRSAKWRKLAARLPRNLPLAGSRMVHRLGTMEIGEASVVVIATAPHRRPAFDAALEGINRLKRLVPVWKKEYFADGEVWVEGEWDTDAPRAGTL